MGSSSREQDCSQRKGRARNLLDGSIGKQVERIFSGMTNIYAKTNFDEWKLRGELIE